jgi:4-hydroxybenzoate polyprenyltransferase
VENLFSPNQVKSITKAVRIQNLFILVFAQYFAVFFLSDPGHSLKSLLLDPKLFFLSLSTVLIAAGGYLINDYYDIKIDYINRPQKVVVGRSISRRSAIGLHTTFNFLGIAIGILLSPWIGLVNLTSATLLWLYSNYLKRQPLVGNLAIGLLSGAAILLVSLLYPQNYKLVALYAFFAAFFSMIREIIKDIEDREGDEKFGCRTLPIVWGVRKTKMLINFLLLVFLATFAGLAKIYLGEYWQAMAIILLLFIIYFMYKLRYADTRKDYGKLSLYCKLILFLGVISMAFII